MLKRNSPLNKWHGKVVADTSRSLKANGLDDKCDLLESTSDVVYRSRYTCIIKYCALVWAWQYLVYRKVGVTES